MPRQRLVQLAGLTMIVGGLSTGHIAHETIASSPTNLPSSERTGAAAIAPGRHAGRPITAGSADLPLTVDGNATPELVPDAVAFRHFMQTTLLSDKPSPEELKRLNARLEPLQFQKGDHEAYVQTMQSARRRLEQVAAQKEALRVASASIASQRDTLRNLATMERQVFDDTKLQLRALLTHAGSTNLELHLRNHVTRHIKIYGSTAK